MLTTIVALVAAIVMVHLRHGATVGTMQSDADRQFMRLKGVNDRISEDASGVKKKPTADRARTCVIAPSLPEMERNYSRSAIDAGAEAI